MGGGDLNMKKSWHPVLLVNQERVWKAEKSANEEKKKLAQLRKEQEEERQLAELQRLQEASTGKKRVEKLDWMYAAPGSEGTSGLGGQRMGDKEMEDYLLGKKRVDEVLSQADKNVGNLDKAFQAVQNANSIRDTASKIREDPLLAIKRQELAQMEALKNRPDIRRKLKEMAEGKNGGDSKEERRAKRKAEKEERRRERHEKRERRDRRDRDSRTPLSDYSDDRSRDRDRSSHRDGDGDRDYKRKRDSYDRYDRDTDDRRYNKSRDRSISPKRERDGSPRRDRDRDYDDSRKSTYRRDQSPRRNGHRSDRRDDRNGNGSVRIKDEEEEYNSRIPPPRHHSNGRETGNGHSGHMEDIKPTIRNRPTAGDYMNGPSRSNGNSDKSNPSSQAQNLEEQRAARLAAMQASATQLDNDRTQNLKNRAIEEAKEREKEERMRKKYGKDDVKGGFFAQKGDMGLSETLSRRGGQGLQKDI